MTKKRISRKKCTKCGEVFPNTRDYFFYRNRKDNILSVECISCRRKQMKKYKQDNEEEIKKREKEYSEKNKDKKSIYNKKYRKKNIEKISAYNKEYSKKYYKNNKEKVSAKGKYYAQKNKEKIKKRKQGYYINNKEHINKRNQEYHKKNYKEYYDNNKDKITDKNKKYYENNKEMVAEANYKWRIQPAKYETYIDKLGYAERNQITNERETRRYSADKTLLEIRCKQCKEWFIPTNSQVQIRIDCIDKNRGGHFYCSQECRSSCSIYRKVEFPEGHKKRPAREVDPYIVELALERDDYECQKCGELENLEVHHIKGATKDPLLANDIDNVITVCGNCHAEIHSEEGCSYADYKRPKCEPE